MQFPDLERKGGVGGKPSTYFITNVSINHHKARYFSNVQDLIPSSLLEEPGSQPALLTTFSCKENRKLHHVAKLLSCVLLAVRVSGFLWEMCFMFNKI